MAAAAGPEEEGLESLYSILEVNRDASAGEIRKKFQSLIRKVLNMDSQLLVNSR